MTGRDWIGTYRVVFAASALVAITYQFFDGWNTTPAFHVGNFWSFFTIQSNLFAAVVLL